MFGDGSDGEFTRSELHCNVGAVAADSRLLGAWGLSRAVGREMEQLVNGFPTDVSRLPLHVSQGEIGTHTIRDEKRTVELTPASTVTFYFDTASDATQSAPASNVVGIEHLGDADERLCAEGYDQNSLTSGTNPGTRTDARLPSVSFDCPVD